MRPAVFQTRAAGVTAILFVASVLLAVTLLAFGVVGEVGFWRLLALTNLSLLFAVLFANADLLGENERWAELAEKQGEILSHVQAIPTVRCAGCRTAAVLDGPVVDDEIRLPPGWGLRNDRPYCGTCLGVEA